MLDCRRKTRLDRAAHFISKAVRQHIVDAVDRRWIDHVWTLDSVELWTHLKRNWRGKRVEVGKVEWRGGETVSDDDKDVAKDDDKE
ncbi:hypothetical protein M8J77_002380 [Diaphorina citri]|nr:hypothetical protein M8J77_002380 [Diaphorina citri]